ncbi:hypothetical protein TcCL_NonESM10375 [Trypanosoma cruzi]|nr:hypothetical protein TcCL_NonESM10375 [Trypanosoma cruzi]
MVQQQSKKEVLLASALFLTLSQSLLLLFPLPSPSQARHAHFNTRPSSTRSPSCAPAAPQRTTPPPSVKQLRVLHVPHNRRHAPAAQHPQRHSVVPPLLSNHERNTQRVQAHVLHALQPQADQVGRHELHLVVLRVLGADPHILSIHGLVLREAAERRHVCGRSKCGETTATLTPSHISTSLHCPTQKGGVMGKRCPPHSTCTRAHAEAMPSTSHRKILPCAQHTHGGNESDGVHPITYRTAIYFSPHG